MHIWQLKVS